MATPDHGATPATADPAASSTDDGAADGDATPEATVASPALELVLDLARLSTPPRRERPAADLVLGYLRDLGLEAVEDDPEATGLDGDTGCIYARVEATAPGEPIFLCAHVDTIPPVEPVDPVIVGGVVTNRNRAILGGDNKASVAGMLDGLRRVLEAGTPHAGFELLITPQEEIGLVGAKAFDAARLAARIGYVYDHAGAIGEIVVAGPTQMSVTATFQGRAAHAGIEPERGANAIVAAAHFLAGVEFGRLDEETTANVGLISGGLAGNVVAPSATVSLEARSRTHARCVEVIGAMIAAATDAATSHGCSVDLDVIDEYRAFRFERSEPALDLARRALAAIGRQPREVRTGGGADAHIFTAAGKACVNLASGMSKVHTEDEFIAVADVDALSDLTVALLRQAVE
jgi:tripeptide aminopeptidase